MISCQGVSVILQFADIKLTTLLTHVSSHHRSNACKYKYRCKYQVHILNDLGVKDCCMLQLWSTATRR